MIDSVIGWFYPCRCAICDSVVRKPGNVCGDCKEIVPFLAGTRCKKCSKPIEEGEYCQDCKSYEKAFIQNYSVFLYTDVMRESVGRFKYSGRKEYANYYANCMDEALKKIVKKWDVQGLVPVPLHESRMRKRGYNQSLVLAREIGKKWGIPVLEDILYREKKTAPQKELDSKERLENLKNAFLVSKNVIRLYPSLKRVIIIDDIYTTGSTMHFCTKALMEAGVTEVYGISLCIGEGR